MYIDQPMSHFMYRLASKSPEPGGGSVAALTGALVSMVANLSLGMEKYKDVQHQVEQLVKELDSLREKLQYLIQKDTDPAKEVAGAITPVPGGVGTVTTHVLLKHIVKATKLQNA